MYGSSPGVGNSHSGRAALPDKDGSVAVRAAAARAYSTSGYWPVPVRGFGAAAARYGT